MERGPISRRRLLGAGALLGLTACTGERGAPEGADRSGRPGNDEARGVPVLCRAAWGAADAVGAPVEHAIERLTVHHTAVPLHHNADAPGQVRAIQRDHQAQAWTDIAYHYLVDIDGNIYQGRDPAYVGDTFTTYDPSGHLLVCLLGHYDEQRLRPAEVEALARILACGVVAYDVAPDTIAGHDAYEPTTSCPGRRVDAVIADGSLAARVAELADDAPAIRLVCGAEGASRVDVIESA